MQENNPYAGPSSNIQGQESYGDPDLGVTRGVVKELRGTKGWTRFIGVLAIIFGGFAIVGGVIASQSMSRLRNLEISGYFGLAGGLVIVVLIIVAVLALVFGFLLNGFSSAVNRVIETRTENDLYEALRRQRSFWIFWGILSLIVTAFSLLGAFTMFMTPTRPF